LFFFYFLFLFFILFFIFYFFLESSKKKISSSKAKLSVEWLNILYPDKFFMDSNSGPSASRGYSTLNP